jgi:signal peptidase II
MADNTALTKKIVRNSILALALMIMGSVGLDQVTKYHAEEVLMLSQDETNLKMYRGKRVPIAQVGELNSSAEDGVPFFISFSLNYVRNQGAAWGALSTVDDSIRIPFFYAVTIIAVTVITLIFRSTPYQHRLARLALAMVLSGAIGNFADRIRLGYVIDWIDIRWNLFGWYYSFPNFNIADSAITVGISFLLFDSIVLESRRNKKSKEAVA